MKPITNIILHIYRFHLCFYPASFRESFAEEMSAVFATSLREEIQNGRRKAIQLCLREIRDWPCTVLAVYLDRLRKYMETTKRILADYLYRLVFNSERNFSMTENNGPANNWTLTFNNAWKAALPPILFGLGITLAPIIAGGKWNEIPRWRLYVSVVVMASPMAVIAVGGFIALFKRIPDWGYTWLGVSMIGAMLLLKGIAEELDDVGKYIISQVGDFVLGGMIALGILIVLVIVAIRGWQQAGLVSMGMASVLGLSLMQSVSSPPMNRQDLSMLSLPLGILAALLIYLYVTKKTNLKILSLTGMGLLNLALIWVAHTAWLPWVSSRGTTTPVLPLTILFSGALLAGPVLGLLGIPIRRKMRNI